MLLPAKYSAYDAMALPRPTTVGHQPRMLTGFQRLRCFDRLGYAWARDALLAAFPTAYREELLKSDNERIESREGAEQEEPSVVVRGSKHPNTAT